MINEVVLVGKIKEMGEVTNKKREIKLEVERPFNDVEGRVSDIFNCKLWNSIFNQVISICKVGDLLAVRGRIINEDDSYQVMAENVVILNKTNNNILKK